MKTSPFPKSLKLLFLFLLFLNLNLNLNPNPNIYALSTKNNYIENAINLELAKNPYWLILLHYKNGKSVINNKSFFLSKKGKTNPKLELIATLNSLFQNENNENSAICRFPARIKWLKKNLNIIKSDLPKIECPEFKEYNQIINAKFISLLFISESFTSPQSMFGHIALRIARRNNDDFISNGHALSFAANLPKGETTTSLIYKGISGAYDGYFTLSSFDKLKQFYNGFQNRDIWEFKLVLSEDELDNFIKHAWELKNINTDYFFFSMNCATALELILKSAKPNIKLTKIAFTTPLEIIDLLFKQGLIEAFHLYPSDAKKLKEIKNALNDDEIEIMNDIMHGKLKVSSFFELNEVEENRKALIIEAIKIKNNMNFLNGRISKNQYLSLFSHKDFEKSERLNSPKLTMQIKANPLKGHDVSRLDIFGGYYHNTFYSALQINPLYHDISDKDAGYTKESSLRFLSTNINYYENKNKFGFNSSIFKIGAYSPINSDIKKMSFELDSKLAYDFSPRLNKHFYGFYLNGGPGLTFNFWEILSFTNLIMLEADASSEFTNNYYLGSHLKSFLKLSEASFAKTITSYIYGVGYSGSFADYMEVELKQYFYLTRNLRLNLEASYHFLDAYESFSASIGASIYF
ncbi:MAG: DUF4105 domain-containing protein [Pseudomonadota bacterium]